MDKKQIRKHVNLKRKAMQDNEVESKSFIVINRLIEIGILNSSKIVFCYVDFNNEVQTRGLIRYLLSKGVRVAVPKIEIDLCFQHKGIMHAYAIQSLQHDLKRSVYGIMEPVVNNCCLIEPRNIDSIIVPAVAFDKSCNRIGMGGGYYDRYMKMLHKACIKIGLAYDFQIFQSLPYEYHDMSVDMVITEGGTINRNNTRKERT